MRSELTILNNLETTIEGHINEFLPSGTTTLSADNVVVDFPDIDRMPKSTMIYIAPDYSDFEPLATCNDQTSFNVKVCLVCKRDTAANLTTKTFAYYNALYETLKKYQALAGASDFIKVENAQFFGAIDMNKNVQGAEISVSVEFTKDF